MPTNKLGLPTVTENMTHDVPRDLNALATAIDNAAGTDLATLNEDGMIPSEQMRPIPGLSTHMNDLTKHISFAVATGTANAYAVSISPAPSSYSDFLAVSVRINADSTGPATLNVNGLGARPLKKANGNDAVGLKANGIYTFRYNASTAAFILQGEGGNGNAQPGDVRKGKTFSNDYGDQVGALDLSKLVPENIKRGVTIDGVTGTVFEDEVNPLITGERYLVYEDNTYVSFSAPTGGSPSTIVKEAIVERDGDVRVKFRTNLANSNHYFRLYHNNRLVASTSQQQSDGIYTTADITGIKAGDKIQIRHSSTASGSAAIYYLHIYIGNVLPFVSSSIINGWAGS